MDLKCFFYVFGLSSKYIITLSLAFITAKHLKYHYNGILLGFIDTSGLTKKSLNECKSTIHLYKLKDRFTSTHILMLPKRLNYL